MLDALSEPCDDVCACVYMGPPSCFPSRHCQTIMPFKDAQMASYVFIGDIKSELKRFVMAVAIRLFYNVAQLISTSRPPSHGAPQQACACDCLVNGHSLVLHQNPVFLSAGRSLSQPCTQRFGEPQRSNCRVWYSAGPGGLVKSAAIFRATPCRSDRTVEFVRASC